MNQAQILIAQALSWVMNHQVILIPVAVLVLNDLVNGTLKYPKTNNFLRILVDVLSTHTNSNSPGTFKLPGTRSQAPSVVGSSVPVLAPK